MLRSYLIIALRNLSKHKVYSLVNILGLSVGIAFFTLLFLIVRYELSYDLFNQKQDRIYRVVELIDKDGMGEHSASMPYAFGETLLEEYGDYVESVVRIFNMQTTSHTVEYEEQYQTEPNVFFADRSFFDVFDFPLKAGDPDSVLSKPNQVVISEYAAKKYFDNADPIGKTITVDGIYQAVVTGVVSGNHSPSHLDFDFLLSFSTITTNYPKYKHHLQKSWSWNPCWTYIVLKKDKAPEELEYYFTSIIEEKYPDPIRDYVYVYLQPLREIHLSSDLDYEISQNGDIAYIYIFSGIALLILLLAGINFTNLSTARYSTRVREVGIRKAIGADRQELVDQFLTEAVLISFISMFFALIFVELLLPALSFFGDKQMNLYEVNKVVVIASVFGSGILVGLLSSIYPAYYLVKFHPAEMLSNNEKWGQSSRLFRKLTVIFLFTISVFLLMSSFVSWKQLHFLMTAPLGFESKKIIVVPLGEMKEDGSYKELKKNLLELEEVSSVTAMDQVIGASHQTRSFIPSESNSDLSSILVPTLTVRDDFLKTFNIKLVSGRNFSEEDSAGGKEIMINTAMTEYLGYDSPKQALGHAFHTLWGNEKIIGVVENFNFRSLHNKPGPMVIFVDRKPESRAFNTNYMAIKLKDGFQFDKEAIKKIKKVWSLAAPYREMNYFYLRDKINMHYFKEMRLAKVSFFFSLVGIFIACLGLFGMSFFIMNHRKKEVAIRKAMGASDLEIMILLSKEFFALVSVAILLAWPVTYFILNNWLKQFPFNVDIGISTFITSALIAYLTTILTVSYYTIKAGIRNPIRDLGSEG
ncbi:ABC transporter permease [Limibacter armeniacum]|uniref:ABC transporter permease n=1 Tax=Limibacter armeniacum TaxID=466084 RepID=UPI002FE644A5